MCDRQSLGFRKRYQKLFPYHILNYGISYPKPKYTRRQNLLQVKKNHHVYRVCIAYKINRPFRNLIKKMYDISIRRKTISSNYGKTAQVDTF